MKVLYTCPNGARLIEHDEWDEDDFYTDQTPRTIVRSHPPQGQSPSQEQPEQAEPRQPGEPS